MKKRGTEFKVKVNDGTVKVYVNGILHVSIKRDVLISVQSWEVDGVYYIQYQTTSGGIMTDYDTADKWLAILKELDSVDLYQKSYSPPV